MYDSTDDTMRHKNRIKELLSDAAKELNKRGENHDQSKLEEPEKSHFDRLTPMLKDLTYGSEDYKKSLKELQIALKHHYENNSHHPEHYENGINDFDLFDLMELFFDWKAASERTNEGNIYKSIELNRERFGISEQLEIILINTAKRLGF